MEIKQIKLWLKKYRPALRCIRFIVLYWICILIAEYSSFYRTGMIPNNILTAVIAAFLIFYRFVSITIVPAIMFLWITDLITKIHENKS